MAITGRKILKYTVLPGIIPRVRDFVRGGFVHIAYLMALIYQSVRLLPRDHPYLQPQNMGRYGIRHVIAEAARHLVFSRRNIDQIVVFFTILAGLILLALQFVILIAAMIQQPAFAMTNLGDWFTTPSANTCGTSGTGVPFCAGPDQDIAFIILDHVFGTQGIFNSCVATAVDCLDSQGNPLPAGGAYPYPIHIALHQLLEFYSWGIFLVSVFIIIYFVITIVGETVVSGTPFGQRYNHAWTPIRIIVFFALLAPINIGGQNDGYNGAQLLTFWTAKFGSNFATNAWGRFNFVLTQSYLGDMGNLIATPNIPEVGTLVQFFHVAKMCQMAEAAVHGNEIDAYIVRENITGADSVELLATSFDDALTFSNDGAVSIRFGEYTAGENPNFKGRVNPLCGEIVMSVNDVSEPGSRAIMTAYYENMQDMWGDTEAIPMTVAMECMLRRILPMEVDPTCGTWPGDIYAMLQLEYYEVEIADDIQDAIADQLAMANFLSEPQVIDKGWAGAAIWYNLIAKMNGAVTAAAFNIPKPKKYPFVMEEIVTQRKQIEEEIDGPQRFDPLLGNDRLADLPRAGDQYIAAALYAAYNFWEHDGYASTTVTQSTGNAVIDTINSILGTSGIFEMRRNPSTHPLAQLSALGRGLIEATVRNVLFGGAGEALSKILNPFAGDIAKSASSFVYAVSQVTLVMGIMLFYVVPFLPFIYFIFGVSGWIKSIFEAMVAMPLWALAHIRIDGEGLPGQAASNGYFLLLEIFVRPILIVTGLVASVSIFSALVIVLNTIFDLVVANLTGFDYRAELENVGPSRIEFYRGPIDEFFFSTIYVIIVYLLANSSFKLIDNVPNNILRWMGISLNTFQEDAGDPAGQFTSQMYRGTTITATQASGGRLAALTG